ncbi:MAG: helix-turn-helix domain-containing protein [Candidatus Cryptobacteroides sp.]
MGLLFLLSGKQLVSLEKLQHLVGAGFILFAAHILVMVFSSFMGKYSDAFRHATLLADLIIFICCGVAVLRSLLSSAPQQKEDSSFWGKAGAEPAEESAAESRAGNGEPAAVAGAETVETYRESAEGVCGNGVTVVENGAGPCGEVQEADGPDGEMSGAIPDEVAEDESVEKLENPNVDDFLFFQKVEALMVNDLLFCEQELSREALATAIGTNRTYLARSIKSATGKTFSEYITDLRTAYAAKLLTTTDEPLDIIGTLVGFRSKSAYYRAFSAAYNCSPSEYRKNSVSRTMHR